MAHKSVNLLFHLFPPHDSLELPFEHDLGQTADNIAHNAYTNDDQPHRKNFPAVGKIVDLFETDGPESNNRHIGSIEQTPPFDGHIAECPP